MPRRLEQSFAEIATVPAGHHLLHDVYLGTWYCAVASVGDQQSVRFAAGDDLLTSGFCWPETQQLIAGKTYLAYFSQGRGHVVAFAGDPNYRAMFPGLQRLFINACLFGPAQ